MRLASLLLFAPLLVFSLVRAADTANPQQAALDALVAGYWQDQLKHDPEMASAVGDSRYDDRLSDYSVEGYNAALDRGRSLLDQLGAMDTAGFTDAEKLKKDQLVNKLVDEQADAASKPWELPLGETTGLPFELTQLVSELTFKSQADYEHYASRLKLVPATFSDITTCLMTGMDDHHVLSKDAIEKVTAQLHAIATAKPEDSIFAQPLKTFPAGVSASEQASDKEELLRIITRQVLPAYARMQKFIEVQYAPAASSSAGSAAGRVASYHASQGIVISARARAETELGAKFNQAAFHDKVRDSIALPPDGLAQDLDIWITQQK